MIIDLLVTLEKDTTIQEHFKVFEKHGVEGRLTRGEILYFRMSNKVMEAMARIIEPGHHYSIFIASAPFTESFFGQTVASREPTLADDLRSQIWTPLSTFGIYLTGDTRPRRVQG